MLLRVLIFSFAIFSFFLPSIHAVNSTQTQLQTSAKGAILLDYNSGKVLYAKNIKDKIYPASTVKIMTAYIAFESIKNDLASLQDIITVSENAFLKGGYSTGSSTMFLNKGEQITLNDALQGMIVQSGNDATIAIAEYLKGSENDFANYMNRVAYRLNLENTNFVNSTGWPNKNQYTTLEDITTIARNLMIDFPQYYHYFAQKRFEHNGVVQNNRNSLLFMQDLNVDGVKTGHTQDSGYVLVFSGVVNGFRYIGAVYGLNSSRERTAESRKIIKWAEKNFISKTIYKQGEEIAEIKVWNSKKSKVSIKAPNDIKIVYPKLVGNNSIKVNINYKNNIATPVKKGTLATAINIAVESDKDLDYYTTTYNVYFTEDIDKDMPLWEKFFYTPLYATKALLKNFNSR